MAKKWIQKLKIKKGALTDKAAKAGAIHGGKIDEGWLKSHASKNDTTGKQARLAIAFRHMKH